MKKQVPVQIEQPAQTINLPVAPTPAPSLLHTAFMALSLMCNPLPMQIQRNPFICPATDLSLPNGHLDQSNPMLTSYEMHRHLSPSFASISEPHSENSDHELNEEEQEEAISKWNPVYSDIKEQNRF